MTIPKYILYLCVGLFLLATNCTESDEIIRAKLNIILKDDLEAILEDVDKDALLDTPYFDLLEYKTFDEGAYSRLAVAEFFFLRSVGVKITRKYRYHRQMGLWDRYYNKYYTIPLESNESEN